MSDLSDLGEQVLRAVSLLGGNADITSLHQKASDLMGLSISQATAYVVLERLEFQGYVDFHGGRTAPRRGPRAQRRAALTALGRQMAASIETRYRPDDPTP